MQEWPRFSGQLRKNDAVFIYGAMQPKPFVFAYEQQGVEVVYGPSCRIADEIRLDNCNVDGVPLVERRGGGGTVVLAPGMVITLIVGMRNGRSSAVDCFNVVNSAIIALLAEAGIAGVVREGISDCALNNRKILGGSLYLGSEPPLYYYQSSLLVSPDISLFDRYLLHPPREPSYRRKRSHKDFCTTLHEQGFDHISACSIAGLFNRRLAEYLDIQTRQDSVKTG